MERHYNQQDDFTKLDSKDVQDAFQIYFSYFFPFYQHCHNELLHILECQEGAWSRDLVNYGICREGWHEPWNSPDSVADIAIVRL